VNEIKKKERHEVREKPFEKCLLGLGGDARTMIKTATQQNAWKQGTEEIANRGDLRIAWLQRKVSGKRGSGREGEREGGEGGRQRGGKECNRS